MKEAIEINKYHHDQYEREIAENLNNLIPWEKDYLEQLKNLHDKLEYYNIQKTLEYSKTSDITTRIKENGITKEILKELHILLTKNLDDFFWDKKELTSYNKYYPGIFRDSNNIRIWLVYPLDYKLMDLHLEQIKYISNNIKTIDDVFYIHWKLYQIHPFNNGNKRICRIIEEILLNNLWVESIMSASHGYYLQQDRYIKQIVNNCVRNKKFETFADFWFSSLLLSSLYVINNEMTIIKREVFKKYDLEIFKNISAWEKFNTKNLEKIFTKKLKISRAWFFFKLDKEKEILKEHLKEEKIGRNIYYCVDIKNSKYQLLNQKFHEILDEYKKFNNSYEMINFLKNF
jgi:Fic family protein